jgi:excinuclease UvrABC nuclease subunit
LELCVVCALGDFDAWVVYCCLDDNGIPLYVGCTYDLVTRLNAHSNRTRNQLSERWWPLVDRVEADVYFDSDEAFEAERAAIRSLSPRFNTLHNRGRAVAA